jgi:hypothetical protein
MNKLFLYFSIVILFLTSCSTSRKVQVIQDALSKKDSINAELISEKTKIDSGLIVKNIIEKITSNKLVFNTMNAHIKVDYQTVDRADAFITNVSIEKGKAIYITARGAMGVIGLKAKITSIIPPVSTLFTKDSIFKSDGPIPSIGEIMPPKT